MHEFTFQKCWTSALVSHCHEILQHAGSLGSFLYECLIYFVCSTYCMKFKRLDSEILFQSVCKLQKMKVSTCLPAPAFHKVCTVRHRSGKQSFVVSQRASTTSITSVAPGPACCVFCRGVTLQSRLVFAQHGKSNEACVLAGGCKQKAKYADFLGNGSFIV